MPGLLQDLATLVEDAGVARDLVAYGALDRSERVDVLGLRAGAKDVRALGLEREVDVRAQGSLVHADVGDAETADQVTDVRDVGARNGRRLVSGDLDRARDDLDQRDAGAVVVDQRVVGAMDTPGGAA